MASPRNGNPGNLVPPAAAVQAFDADVAIPGEVERLAQGQEQTGTGKYGRQPAKAFKPQATGVSSSGGSSGSAPSPAEVIWIEIVLVDAEGRPVAGEAYRITMPDDTVKEGTLDEHGFARVEGMDPGTCKVTFPELDGRSWKKL